MLEECRAEEVSEAVNRPTKQSCDRVRAPPPLPPPRHPSSTAEASHPVYTEWSAVNTILSPLGRGEECWWGVGGGGGDRGQVWACSSQPGHMASAGDVAHFWETNCPEKLKSKQKQPPPPLPMINRSTLRRADWLIGCVAACFWLHQRLFFCFPADYFSG